MKRIIYITLPFLLLNVSLKAQSSYDIVLKSIEENNTTLQAYKEQTGANKIANKTGINMENPEVEFGYLWGSPTTEGKQKELTVKQTFDFPTAYRYKSQLARGKNKQEDLLYDQERRNILQEASSYYIELVFLTKLNKQLVERVQHARELSDAYEKSFSQGNISVLERNKTKLDLLNNEKALQMNEVEIDLKKAELIRLNGGKSFLVEFETYPEYVLPSAFNEWFIRVQSNNPSLQIAEKQIELSRKQEQLTKALNLPKISAGYRNESVGGVTFQGVTVGVSIPLWEGKNTVKHQKAQTAALKMQHEDTKLQFQNTLKLQFEKASKLTVLLKEYEEALRLTNNRDILKKALDQKQVSLIDYLLELGIYYETIYRYLETERDYQLAIVELMQWEL
ncbi:TolC family protein [Dysgonomonas sp. Marseille-P4361]|uniref:TolC family protein n=1 Tax=Dysgonomonas sp. Marseille-P4361 TaxID=2161820 RepID=UPI000D553319|nr:TolC family protein [Dysgonomonas sp. Marseille-P4361]